MTLVDVFAWSARAYLLAIGGVLLSAAVFTTARRIAALVAGEATTGRVVDHHASSIDDSVTYQPIVEFADQERRVRRFTAGSGGTTKHPPVGSVMAVRYQRARPDVAYVPTFMHMWAAPIALTLLGAGALVAAWRQ